MAPGSKKKKSVMGSDPNPRSLALLHPLMRSGGHLSFFMMRVAMARGSGKKRKKGVKGSDPTAKLTDDILADIISRVPSQSVCRCKCVSRRWRDLVAHRDYRGRMAQPLAGFFHKGSRNNPKETRFTSVSGKGDPLVNPSLPFLPQCIGLDVLDCCNGLLLCRGWKNAERQRFHYCYVVCNPATEKWVDVPATKWSNNSVDARLGFDPAVSSHFHVYEFIDGYVSDTEDEEEEEEEEYEEEEEDEEEEDCIKLLATYSSKAGSWTHQRVVKHNSFAVHSRSRSVFLNGVLYLAALGDMVLAVDVEGNGWRLILIPEPQHDSDALPYNVFPSQGRLYLAQGNAGYGGSLSVWVLEDCRTGKWTLKHNVGNSQLFESDDSFLQDDYTVISFHPERNMVFIVSDDENVLVSYDMDCRKLSFICEFDLRSDVYDTYRSPFIPYVPLLSESLADEH